MMNRRHVIDLYSIKDIMGLYNLIYFNKTVLKMVILYKVIIYNFTIKNKNNN